MTRFNDKIISFYLFYFYCSELFASVGLGERNRREKRPIVGPTVSEVRESYERIGSTYTFVGQSVKFLVSSEAIRRIRHMRDEIHRTQLIFFFLKTFGLNPADREQLDIFLVTAYVKNVPPNFHLLQPAGSRYQYCEFNCTNRV